MHRLGFWKWAWGERPWMSLTLTKYPQRVDAVKILGIAFTTPRNVPLHLFGRRLACERANKWLKDIRRRFNLFERGANFVIFNLLHSCAKWLSGPSHCRMKQDIIFPRKHANGDFLFQFLKKWHFIIAQLLTARLSSCIFSTFFLNSYMWKCSYPHLLTWPRIEICLMCVHSLFSVLFFMNWEQFI